MKASLADRLAGYSAAAKTLTGRRAWSAYAAAAGSALAMTTGATAGIIYSGPKNLSVSVTAPGGGSYNNRSNVLVNVAGGSFTIEVQNEAFSDYHLAAAYVNPAQGTLLMASGITHLENLPSGATISSPGDWTNRSKGAPKRDVHHTTGAFTSQGNFPVGHTPNQTSGTGIAGVRVRMGSTSLGAPEYDYGWLRIGIYDTTSSGFLDTLTAIDWAYQSVADTPIRAGDTGAAGVPEPGTLSLMLLALGSAGVLAWKRRRKAAE